MHEESSDRQVAIVGIGCRFAGGASTPEKFLSSLLAGSRSAGPVPPGRWDAAGGRSRENAAALSRVTARGSFLDDVAGFDNGFFGISGVEAAQMDPQQRIALEVAWEALEHAGVDPHALAGTDTGVYLGVGTDDYGRRLLEDLPGVRAWTGIGASLCAVANRISHVLDLRGPSFAVDTACSSSLVALHQAYRAVADGEVPLALAGGVMIMAGPGLTAVLDEAAAISGDGVSKTFTAAADGYGRGEGCGVVVLKRLADAIADNDHVWAVVRGGAVRQDGRTDGIMAPSGSAQEHVMRAAYADAGVDPRDVGYVEAHGTGTRVGDPIELAAMAAVLGEGGCLVGAVKPNIGHTEAAAGIAGVIKTALALDSGVIPPTPMDGPPRPDFDWTGSGLEVVTEARPLTSPYAGVASYGYGGTIAHIVLERGPEALSAGTAEEADLRLYPVSAASPEAFRSQAAHLADAMPGLSLTDVGHTLAHRRAHLPVRGAVVAADHESLVAGLRTVEPAETVAGKGVVWVFSGHGAQWTGMGKGLLATEPVFAEVVDRLTPIFIAELGVIPRDVLESDDLGGVDRIQALLYLVQVGLAALWRHRGIEPAAVIGHSVGEIAAAVVAGVLTEEQGATLVCRRSRLLPEVAGRGAMAMVDLPFAAAVAYLDGRTDVVAAIAAAPASTVLAGAPDAIAEVSAALTAEDRVVRRVDSDVAFHSPQMAPLAERLAEAVADLEPAPARVPVYVTAADDPRSAPRQDAGYWAANLRDPVRFAAAVEAAVEDGHRLFLEISAHPVVGHSVTEVLHARGVAGAAIASLRRGRDEVECLLAALASLYAHGVDPDWDVLQPAGSLTRLPGVKWRHTRHWIEGPAAEFPPDTLLGTPVDVHGSLVRIWATTLESRTRPYPGRHPVLGTEIVPAAVLLNTFLAAGECEALRDVRLRIPVAVPDEESRELQVVKDGSALRIVSRSGGDWVVHTTAAVEESAGDVGPFAVVTDDSLALDHVVTRLAELGVAAMGYDWRFTALERGPGALRGTVAARGWTAILDAALSLASVAFDGPPVLRMPAGVDGFGARGEAPEEAEIVVRVDADRPFTVDVHVAAGESAAWLRGLRYGELDGDRGDSLPELNYAVRWSPLPLTDGSAEHADAVVLGDGKLAAMLGLPRADSVRAAVEAGAAHLLLIPAYTDSEAAVGELLETARALDAVSGTKPRLWCVTSGVRAGESADALAFAPLHGVSRVGASEHPDFWGGAVDLPTEPTAIDIKALAQVLATRSEPVLAVADGEVRVPRLAPVAGGAVTRCRPEAAYLVTGGLGALGLKVAGHLAQRGARRLVLLGRTPLPPRETWDTDPRGRAVRELELAGVTVFPVVADIADAEGVRAALAALPLPPVAGVVHAAGTVRSGLMSMMSEEDLAEVMRPKIDGAKVLHELFPSGALDFMVLFSSAGPLLGLPGQTAYAAANAYLDALAAYRGPGTVSVAWTSWRGLGMSTSASATDVELAARGAGDVTAEEALRAFDRLLGAQGGGTTAVVRVRRDHSGPRPSVLADLAVETDEHVRSTSGWDGLEGEELSARLGEIVAGAMSAVLGIPVDTVNPHRALTEAGVDSLLASALRVRLERETGVALPATLLWNHPTPAAITGFLAEIL
ncbi:type I polyketide synthase [Amycolatopsis thailandensis]|uniref:type I polyketide synthase n=1 Tax=Amycolatopsis thailandensis TaxID=589330 RepID=UPI0036335D6C